MDLVGNAHRLPVRNSWRNELLKETSQESALVRFLRAGVLLGTMVLIPGVAVCWNLLPKPQYVLPSFVSEAQEEPTAPSESEEMFGTEPAPPAHVEPPVVRTLPLRTEPDRGSSPGPLQSAIERNPTVPVAPFPMTAASSDTIKAMSWIDREETKTIPIPTVVAESSAAAITPAIPTAPGAGLSPQQHFPQLESELQALGVKYYRLQKWGAHGELVRVSCYVAVAEPYHCQKYFQDIDRDEIRVMERVIAQIKAWRK